MDLSDGLLGSGGAGRLSRARPAARLSLAELDKLAHGAAFAVAYGKLHPERLSFSNLAGRNRER
jgi:hypothetical protein